ncbi:putative NUDIX domain protein [Rosellinia necatrix]|uniref:Putative NUDIX domain protein n=1 Tax=Rosellinia necatrix TaxID=77044 RepID=A0A1W2TIB7_ROSNE|nr:putative NUDIX domain protein [Rosellinia necatrix]
MTEGPVFHFNYDSSLTEFAVSKASYLADHPDVSFGYIATSSLVVVARPGFEPRILLLQRAASDSSPNKWEPPGGACEDGDASILHAAARKLKKEAGLEADFIAKLIGDPYFFRINLGNVCQFNFVVRVKTGGISMPAVKLDPKEHQRLVWATEGEVRARKIDDIDLDFTSKEVEDTVLLALKGSE